MSAESGYSVTKTAVIWAGGLLTVITVIVGIVVGTKEYGRQQTERITVCLEAGNTPSECAVAVGDR